MRGTFGGRRKAVRDRRGQGLRLIQMILGRPKSLRITVVSDSYRPHGLQSTRLLRLWDSPGEEGTPAGLSSCSGGLRHLVELCVEPAGLCGRCTGVPGSSVHGILQVRILEWLAISFSRGASQPRDVHQKVRRRGPSFHSPGRSLCLTKSSACGYGH